MSHLQVAWVRQCPFCNGSSTNSNGNPFLCAVEQRNAYKYFLVTTCQQQHEATAWGDGLNDVIDEIFTVDKKMAFFLSERACLRSTNRSGSKPWQTPVDAAYFEILRNVLGNPQEFPALEVEDRDQEKLGPAESAWKCPISILYRTDTNDNEPQKIPAPASTGQGVEHAEI